MDALIRPDASASAMMVRFGFMYHLLGLSLLLRKMKMDDFSSERVRKAAAKGPVVYVLHTKNLVDWLALNQVLQRRGLPLPVHTNEVDATLYQPLPQLVKNTWERARRLGQQPEPLPGELAGALASGQPLCVFLTSPLEVADVFGWKEPREPLTALELAQSMTERPIQILPVVVMGNRTPERQGSEVERFLDASLDTVGGLRRALQLAWSDNGGRILVGEAVDFKEFQARYAQESPEGRLRRVRVLLRRFLYREEQVTRGPKVRSRALVRRKVLQSREITELVEREAAATGASVHGVQEQVAKTFEHVAAAFSPGWLRVARWVTSFLWNQIFDGVDIRPEDLERIRQALRAGTPVLVPCHRSHLDYLLVSSLLYENDIIIPHVVAGENLSFWPVGPVFRRLGAFFIRRSFQGERVFPAVFQRYLKELIHMEVPVEFFLEGGRSRTGKLLPPKLGVLGMVVDAAAEGRPDREVTFLPIYLGYDTIPEEGSYARELLGGKKKAEDVGQVVRASRVLTRRYGRVYVRVGEPLTAGQITGGEEWKQQDRAQRQERLGAAGEQILHRINAVSVILPTGVVGAALLAHPRRGIRSEELRGRVERFRALLQRMDVPISAVMAQPDVKGWMEEALHRFAKGKLITALEEEHGRVWSIQAERRISLDYHRNTVLHALALPSFLAAAIRAEAQELVPVEEVRRLFRFQVVLFRLEIFYDPNAPLEVLEERAWQALQAHGALEAHGEALRVKERARVAELANLTAALLESYLLLIRAVDAEVGKAANQKALSERALALGKTLLAVDELQRPESLSLQNLQHATRVLTESGAIRFPRDGRLEADPERLQRFRADLARLAGIDLTTGL